MSNGFCVCKVCLRDNRVFLIYLAIYLLGNDYFVLVFMWLTLGQTQLIHKLMFFTNLFINFVLIEMREKLRSQRETVISLPKSRDSRRNHET